MSENSFDQIKKLMKILGGKAVIVEDGRPTMVVISIDECFDLNKFKNLNFCEKNSEDKIDELNYNINTWKKRQESRKVEQLESNIKESSQFLEKKDEPIMEKEEIIVKEL